MAGNKPTPGSLKLRRYLMFSKELLKSKERAVKELHMPRVQQPEYKRESGKSKGNGKEKLSASFVIFNGTVTYDKLSQGRSLVLY